MGRKTIKWRLGEQHIKFFGGHGQKGGDVTKGYNLEDRKIREMGYLITKKRIKKFSGQHCRFETSQEEIEGRTLVGTEGRSKDNSLSESYALKYQSNLKGGRNKRPEFPTILLNGVINRRKEVGDPMEVVGSMRGFGKANRYCLQNFYQEVVRKGRGEKACTKKKVQIERRLGGPRV